MHPLTVHVVTTSGGGFDSFGWDSLVAIATIILAAGTAWLAWSTRSLARETGDDVRAEFRPVLVAAKLQALRLDFSTAEPIRVQLGLRLQNDGTGPALDTLVNVSVDSAVGHWAGCETLGTISVRADDEANFNLDHQQPSDPQRHGVLCAIEVKYRDVSDWPHKSRFVFESGEGPGSQHEGQFMSRSEKPASGPSKPTHGGDASGTRCPPAREPARSRRLRGVRHLTPGLTQAVGRST